MNTVPAVAIDTTFFAHSEARNKKLTYSTSIFAADLLNAFTELGFSKYCTLIVSEPHAQFFREYFPSYKQLILRWFPLTLLSKISHGKFAASGLIKKIGIYKKNIEHSSFNVIWFPYTIPESYVDTKIPGILTIHDMYRLHARNNVHAYKNIADENHNQIVAISTYTKNDIIASLGYRKEIPVIPNSIDFDDLKTEIVQGISKPFILDINAYIAKKNTITLFKAFNIIKDSVPFDVVCCGGYKDETYFSMLQEYIHKYALEDRIHMLYKISEAQKKWLLKNAALFVTPSLYEGFGRTPIEAAICNVPVISTKETSLYETTMGLVNYYDNATDENELADTILTVIRNSPSQTTLSSIANTFKTTYAVKNCAQKYIALFNHILSS